MYLPIVRPHKIFQFNCPSYPCFSFSFYLTRPLTHILSLSCYQHVRPLPVSRTSLAETWHFREEITPTRVE